MDLAQLITQLRPLLANPAAHWDDITALLDRGSGLAEYEVARFYAARALGPQVDARLRSEDPRERRAGVDAVKLTYSRADAARVLRHMVKDPDLRVRSRARGAVSALGLDDVALPLPDVRRNPRYGRPPGWNPSGWLFGTRNVRRPTRTSRLAALGLPRLADGAAVARLVGVAEGELRALIRPGTGQGAPYVSFEIAKASGGTRRIAAPRQALKRVQRVILDEILARMPVDDACHGFVPGRSTVTNAAPHEGAAVVIKLDLRDFFPTIHYRRVSGLFAHYGYTAQVADVLAALTTHRPVLADGTVVWPGVLPQGAPTSPAISNLVCRRMDRRIAGLAARFGAVYTRYADDITLSLPRPPEGADDGHGQVSVGRLLWWVDQIVGQEGFAENPRKRRILRRSSQQRVTGVVVNAGVHVPRADRRRFRAILHNCRVHGVASQAAGRDDFRDYLRGFAAYVHMVQPALGARLIREVADVLATDGRGGGDGGGAA